MTTQDIADGLKIAFGKYVDDYRTLPILGASVEIACKRLTELQSELDDLRGLLAWWQEHRRDIDLTLMMDDSLLCYSRDGEPLGVRQPSLESALRAAREHVAAWEREHGKSFWE